MTVVLSLFICSLAAFAFVFLRWTGRDLVLSVILATLIVPFETIAIPLLLVVSKLPWLGLDGFSLGWLNTYRVQIVPFIADGLTIFLFVQYFKDLPERPRGSGAGRGSLELADLPQDRHAPLRARSWPPPRSSSSSSCTTSTSGRSWWCRRRAAVR